MDLDEFRLILRESGVDLWTLISTAISVAGSDYRNELRNRRDGIVEQLYAAPVREVAVVMSMNGGGGGGCERVDSPKFSNEVSKEKQSSSLDEAKGYSPYTPQSVGLDDEKGYLGVKGSVIGEEYTPQLVGLDDDKGYLGVKELEMDVEDGDDDGDDEQRKIFRIREELENPNQSDNSVIDWLQTLADMDVTFKGLQATDIGRHVNHLRRHRSREVQRLVKKLVRKWKDIVDEFVANGGDAIKLAAYGDSPQPNVRKPTQNGQYQVPDFAYSPNPTNGSSGSDKNNSEPEPKRRMIPKVQPQRSLPQKRPNQPSPVPVSSAPLPNKQRDKLTDSERLASARKRLHENYLEAENAKKQRTIQVMDIKDVPKPKNRRGGFQARHW